MRSVGAVLLLLCSAAAQAQVSGSVSVESDYRYRGYSLSDGRPVAKLLLQYDAAGGGYGGVQLRRARAAPGLDAGVDLLGYAGYASRLGSTVALDAGVALYTYSAKSHNNYQELHIGLSTERYAVRASYSPNLLGFGARTLYLQADSSYALADGWSLFGHIGHMQALGADKVYGKAALTDMRLGVGTGLGEWNLQLAWDAADTGAYDGYRGGYWTRAARAKFLLIAARPF